MHRIALITDFGMRDPYVAAMKGVIASRTDVAIHDLTHEIAPFDVLEAAWFLRAVAAYWPAETIFVCVVDPGVGTARRIVAVEHDSKIFLAPDNGLLTFVWSGVRAHSVENEMLFLPDGSTTFHGRDRFAPVAAALANGLPLSELGPAVDRIETAAYDPPAYGASVRGTIVHIDRFGNAITDIERARVPFDDLALGVGDVTIERMERNYGDAKAGPFLRPFLIVGSSGHLEISVAHASAAERLQLRRLDRVNVWQRNGASSRF